MQAQVKEWGNSQENPILGAMGGIHYGDSKERIYRFDISHFCTYENR